MHNEQLLLSLPNTESLKCEVFRYTANQDNTLVIIIMQRPTVLACNLTFHNVHHFEGPLLWTGASFSESPKDDFEAFIHEWEYPPTIPTYDLMHRASLYTAPISLDGHPLARTVRVIAEGYSVEYVDA